MAEIRLAEMKKRNKLEGARESAYLRQVSQTERYFKPCVNGDTSFLRERPKFDPLQNQTPERIGMKFGTVDYFRDNSPQNKFGNDRSSGGFWVNM